jgi:protein gp37
MAQGTSIQWTEATWNPIAGCTPVSPGCLRCYAAVMAHRLEHMGQEKYRGLTVLRNGIRTFNGNITTDEAALTIPLRRRKPTTWFVNSMSDLFHEAAPFEFVDKVFAVMALTPHHTYQILTKRPERMAEYLAGCVVDGNLRGSLAQAAMSVQCNTIDGFDRLVRTANGWPWPLPNVWLGTSVEDQKRADERIPHLLRCPAAVRFLSVEPLLEEVDILGPAMAATMGTSATMTTLIQWVIVGGESGAKARPMDVNWARRVVHQCEMTGTAIFVKQLGASPVQKCGQCGRMMGHCRGGAVDACGPTHAVVAKELMGIRDSKGGEMSEWPADLRVRELPRVREVPLVGGRGR